MNISRVLFLWSAMAAALSTLSAQTIQFDQARKVWLVTTAHSSYAMGVSPEGQLQHLYWGAPLWRMADLAAASSMLTYPLSIRTRCWRTRNLRAGAARAITSRT